MSEILGIQLSAIEGILWVAVLVWLVLMGCLVAKDIKADVKAMRIGRGKGETKKKEENK